MAGSFTDEGIVLRRVNYAEADRVLTVLTREHGKVGVIVRGVRRAGSRMAAQTDLFERSRMQLAEGRGELLVLAQAQRASGPPPGLTGDPRRSACAAVIAAITTVYLGVYTPLKRYTWMCNVVGAVSGALPPVAGWAAARGGLGLEPIVLFAIMFLWQLPHTFAVARLFRTDYARAGIRLLPDDTARGGNPSNLVVIAGCLGLVAVGIIPTMLGFAGIPYMVIASALGLGMLMFGFVMIRSPGNTRAARRLLLASLVYLPIVWLVLVLDRV